MFLTEQDANEVVRIVRESVCDEGAEVEIFADCGLDVYCPIENTGFGLHTASNGEVIKAIMYFKDAEGGWKDIHAYIEEYICDMDKYDFIYGLPDMLEDMAMRLERAVERAFRERGRA